MLLTVPQEKKEKNYSSNRTQALTLTTSKIPYESITF